MKMTAEGPDSPPAAGDSERTVLVIDDERDVVDLIAFNLERAGFQTIKAYDGNAGLAAATRALPCAIILDIMLPGRNGYQVFEALKQDSRTRSIPVLMLSAKAETPDRVLGLKMGADDYVTKPFSPKELVLRIQALLKWRQNPASGVQIRTGPFLLDKVALKCYLNGEPLNLTGTEFKILAMLLEREGETISREEFLEKIWNTEETGSRTLDNHVMRLREKLGSHAECLKNLRGCGYAYQPVASE